MCIALCRQRPLGLACCCSVFSRAPSTPHMCSSAAASYLQTSPAPRSLNQDCNAAVLPTQFELEADNGMRVTAFAENPLSWGNEEDTGVQFNQGPATNSTGGK